MNSHKTKFVIEAGKPVKEYWKILWVNRELLYFLAWRDILVKYKQTSIGLAWVLVRPILTMLILTFVFGSIANLDSQGVPYAVLVLTGLLPWFFFSNSFSDCSNSLISNANLLTKVYFPRLIIPISAVIVSIVDFAASTIVLFILIVWYQIGLTWHVVFLPILALWIGFLALGIGLWFSVLIIKYRDFRHILPFVLQLGLYASPVAYSVELVPDKWLLVYYLNPMAGVIDAFRWVVINRDLNIFGVLYSLSFTFVVLLCGSNYFKSQESTFADEV